MRKYEYTRTQKFKKRTENFYLDILIVYQYLFFTLIKKPNYLCKD